jgi:hypothetical protein
MPSPSKGPLRPDRIIVASFEGIENLAGLTRLDLGFTNVTDAGMIYLEDCKALERVSLNSTKVSDAGLAHLKGLPLTGVWIEHIAITDLTPLQGMHLQHIRLTPNNITRGPDILRGMKSLKTIGILWNQSWPAAEFWERYDKGSSRSQVASVYRPKPLSSDRASQTIVLTIRSGRPRRLPSYFMRSLKFVIHRLLHRTRRRLQWL